MGKLSPSTASCTSTLDHIIVYYSISILCFTHLFLNLKQVEGGFDSLLQLPHSGSPTHRLRSKIIFNVNHYGAKGDGVTDDTKVFEDVWKSACLCSSKPKIVIPAGSTFLVRPIDFGGPCQSKLTLTISGVIIAPKDPDAWEGLNPLKWLYFHQVNQLTVEGEGIINGMGHEWWAQSCKINSTNPCHHAPRALTFHRCNSLKVRNLAILNSQQMHVAFTNCVRVSLSHLKVLAPGPSPNTDGIHISSSTHVEIKHAIIKTGDDCISIVGNSSRIRIRNIFCGPGHGISIGSLGKSESLVQVHDVEVDGAFLSNTENGVRIKTWQGGGGFAAKMAFRNVWTDNVSNPIIIDQYYCDSLDPCLNQTLAVKVGNISFVGIRGTSATEEAIRFACSDTNPCENLYLEDIQLVSYYGGDVRSFCWKAQGSFSGLIYPPPCFSYNLNDKKHKVLSSIKHKVLSSIKHKVPSSSVLQSM